jgi:hypothetical protein
MRGLGAGGAGKMSVGGVGGMGVGLATPHESVTDVPIQIMELAVGVVTRYLPAG